MEQEAVIHCTGLKQMLKPALLFDLAKCSAKTWQHFCVPDLDSMLLTSKRNGDLKSEVLAGHPS